MENSSTIRRRVTRNARESTPEPTKKKLIRVGSDRRVRDGVTDVDDDNEDMNTVYVVKGVLNVGSSGAASPTGSISSSSSGSGGSKPSSGSHAYRAKILRYKTTIFILFS